MKRIITTMTVMLFAYWAQAQCVASFTVTSPASNPMEFTLTNGSSWSQIPGSTPVITIIWGDGSTNTMNPLGGSAITHTYTSPGSYTIFMNFYYYDSLNSGVYCSDTTSQTVTAVHPPCYSTINQFATGNGSFSFFAINNNSGNSFLWDFGDGTTDTGASTTHTYPYAGNYLVTLYTFGQLCDDTISVYIQNPHGALNCTTLSADFAASGTGLQQFFANTSTVAQNPFGMAIENHSIWYFGDGSAPVTNDNSPSHTYATAGTYQVKLVNQWFDTVSNSVQCADSITKSITVTAPPPAPNVIDGYIFWDTTNVANTSFKVWLIQYDSVSNSLTALDSQIVQGTSSASYQFPNLPAGNYYTKAAVMSGMPGVNTLIPTYHSVSPYWNQAQVIAHTGQSSVNKNILMVTGYNTGGSGFISGNISQGANKGTGSAVVRQLVILRDSAQYTIDFTYTDLNGDYSFGSLPAGTYTVYPESMNYQTMPSAPVLLKSGQWGASHIDFEKSSTAIYPVTTGISSVEKGDPFRIFPNPTQGILQIDWTESIGTATVNVVDVMGRTLFSVTGQTSGIQNLDLSWLQMGVYLIQVQTRDGDFTKRVVLQK